MSATTGRRALTAGPLVPAGVLAVTVPGGLLTRVLMPGASGTVRALVVTAVLTGVALAVRPCFGPWAAPGGDRPRTWWRAPVLVPLLAPLGPARGVLVGSALFGLAHLGKVLYRDSVALVLSARTSCCSASERSCWSVSRERHGRHGPSGHGRPATARRVSRRRDPVRDVRRRP